VSKGWLKASHREKDQARSTPQRPFYTHSSPQPLAPGVIYQFDIEVGRRRDGWSRLPSVAYVFKKGHRIRLELANGGSPATDGVFSHPYHPSLMGTDTIHHDAVHASRIILPVLVAKRD
jgi:predicted acyl esterase